MPFWQILQQKAYAILANTVGLASSEGALSACSHSANGTFGDGATSLNANLTILTTEGAGTFAELCQVSNGLRDSAKVPAPNRKPASHYRLFISTRPFFKSTRVVSLVALFDSFALASAIPRLSRVNVHLRSTHRDRHLSRNR